MSHTSLDISGLKTTYVTDMSGMFRDCSSLTSLDVSGFNTTNVTDMSDMFYGCSSLTSLDVSDLDTGNVTDMSGMFRDCSSLTSLDVSGFNTANVTDMSGMFRGCSSLANLAVSGFNTTNVTNMIDMFYWCSSLDEVDLSGFDTSNVTDMSGMFRYCMSLDTLDVSGFDTSNVTDMKCMLMGCQSLINVDLTSLNTSNVTNMALMFYDCFGLTGLDVSSFNTGNVTSMEAMFMKCSNLTGLDLSGFDTTKVTNMSSMLYDCSSLATIHTPKTMTTGQSIALPYTLYDIQRNDVTALTLDNCNMILTKEMSYAITYKLYGGTNNSKNPSYYNKTMETITLKDPARIGCSFEGWYSDSTFQNKVTEINSNDTKDITLYAKWNPTEYTITYKLEGGTNNSANPSVYNVTTSTIILKNPTKTGYTFDGWYSDSAYKNEVTKITKGSTGNKTLYAKWSKTEYKITYKLSGGTNNSANPNKYYVTSTITLKKPTKTSYTFEGWYSDSAYKNKVTQIKKGSTGNKTLYAKWTPKEYKITYKLSGGTNNNKNPDTYYVTTSTITLKKPTKTGYTFEGWYSDSAYKNKVTQIKKGSTGNKTLYAKWSKKEYKITYKLSGGTNNSKNPDTYYVTTSTITLKKPTRTGYTFEGWYSDSAYKNKVTQIKKGSTGNKTLYAKWTKK